MKKLFVIIIMLLAVNAFSQWSYQKYNYGGGEGYGFTLSIDSTTTSYTSNLYDWTKIDGQTVYLTWSFVQDNFGYGAGNDTLLAIVQGQTLSGVIFNVDTLGTSNIIVSGLTKNAGAIQATVSASYVTPLVRLYIAHKNSGTAKNGDNSTLYLDIYSKVNDALYR